MSATSFLDHSCEALHQGHIQAGMPGLFEGLRMARTTFSVEAWRGDFVPACRQHPVFPLVQHDPINWRVFNKPRGYPGDAIMLDLMYAHDEAELLGKALNDVSPLGQDIYQFMASATAAEAVRLRRDLLARKIDDTAARRPGAGVLLVRTYGAQVDGQVVSVRDILKGHWREEGFDLIYAAGLYDYLEYGPAAGLSARLFEMLGAGGTMLLGNYLPDIPDVGYMEAFLDWWLIYRTPPDLLRTAISLPASAVEQYRTFTDRIAHIGFLEVVHR